MPKSYWLRSVAALVLFAAVVFAAEGRGNRDFTERFSALEKNQSHETDAERLRKLFAIQWEYLMTEYPEWATEVGYPGQNGRWTDNSLEEIERRKHEPEIPLHVLASIDRAKLSPADQLNFDLFKRDLEEYLAGSRFKGEYLAITQLGGVQQDVPGILGDTMPHRTLEDYQNLEARLKRLPALVRQTLVLLKLGLTAGITPPRITLRDVPQQVACLLVEDPWQNPLLQSFTNFPPDFPAKERDELRAEAATTLKNEVLPAYHELHEYLVKTYLPDARESIGMSALPDGAGWYAYNVHAYTTTELAPKEIHELGLSEMKRIRKEMDAVIAGSGFKGSFDEFNQLLRTNSQFYFTSADSLLTGYRDIAKRADPELIKLFGKLPRLPYGVLPVPAYSEKSQTTAYYQPGSLAAGRPGNFFANTYALNTRPKWEMVPLSLHESVPGHHLQISLAQELQDVPEFRKYGGYTAFVEGWGLYAEGLGSEMGFYHDPYSNYGRLTYEMWRAIRLVLDTGIHNMGWTRRQAIDFFKANTGKNEHDITVEVDRYIVTPGQALAYKIGELKFKELRAYAKEQLGAKFDIRAFHDELLGNGALPMDVLDRHMREWVARQKG